MCMLSRARAYLRADSRSHPLTGAPTSSPLRHNPISEPSPEPARPPFPEPAISSLCPAILTLRLSISTAPPALTAHSALRAMRARCACAPPAPHPLWKCVNCLLRTHAPIRAPRRYAIENAPPTVCCSRTAALSLHPAQDRYNLSISSQTTTTTSVTTCEPPPTPGHGRRARIVRLLQTNPCGGRGKGG